MLAERLTAQLLAGSPARDPLAVARRLLAIQAQDLRGARLAIRARTQGLTVADVDRALTEERSLLITWLNRGTLHLVPSEDYAWLHALTTPQLRSGSDRRLAQEGVSPAQVERGVATVERALAGEGPLTREQLRERLDTAGVPTAGQALVHVLMRTALEGRAVRGPLAGGRHAYVLVRDWLGEPRRPPVRERALAELARRFLAGHGPADARDLAKWAGIGLRDARAGLSAIAGELRQRPDGLLDLATRASAAALPPPRLLGAFEPLLMGWADRTPVLDGHTQLVTSNGIFRASALVGGRAAGTWSLAGGRVAIQPFGRLAKADAAALAAEADDVLRFLQADDSAV